MECPLALAAQKAVKEEIKYLPKPYLWTTSLKELTVVRPLSVTARPSGGGSSRRAF